MGKTRNLIKKIRDTKGIFHAKMGTIRDRNCMDLTETEDMARIHRVNWHKYRVSSFSCSVVSDFFVTSSGELYKKDLHNPDNHNGVITHAESDILECEVKWDLESITMNKASEDDRIPVELNQIIKDDAVKVLHSICQHIWKNQH